MTDPDPSITLRPLALTSFIDTTDTTTILVNERPTPSLTLDATTVRDRWYALLHRVEREGLWVLITHRGVGNDGRRIAALVPFPDAPGMGVTITTQRSRNTRSARPIATLIGVRMRAS